MWMIDGTAILKEKDSQLGIINVVLPAATLADMFAHPVAVVRSQENPILIRKKQRIAARQIVASETVVKMISTKKLLRINLIQVK